MDGHLSSSIMETKLNSSAMVSFKNQLGLASMLAPEILLLIGSGETVETVKFLFFHSPRFQPWVIISLCSVGVE
jgi:hypothetical protein